VFTYERAQQVPDSPASYSQFLRRIVEAKALDTLTLQLRTDRPDPLLLYDPSNVAIVSRKNGTGATTADYNSGKATIGTGPYRLIEWVPGDRLVLGRYDNFWGTIPAWQRVLIRPIKNPGTRTAAILAGDVDLINFVPSVDVVRLEKTPAVRLARAISTRLFYFFPDDARDVSPFVTDKDGRPITKNPLKDVRVRRAISKAIDCTTLVNRILDGVGAPAGQFMADNALGASPRLKPEVYDPDGAKRLLADAGYPDGFGLTLHGPNDRYLNDTKVVQAVAQMLTRVGITSKVETLPASTYFGRASKLEFSFIYVGSSGSSRLLKNPLHRRGRIGFVRGAASDLRVSGARGGRT
jgi:peptide/nickel transport system substrate-binding protein